MSNTLAETLGFPQETVSRAARYVEQGRIDWAIAIFLNTGLDYESAFAIVVSLMSEADSAPALT